jgi:hypothetical protein
MKWQQGFLLLLFQKKPNQQNGEYLYPWTTFGIYIPHVG